MNDHYTGSLSEEKQKLLREILKKKGINVSDSLVIPVCTGRNMFRLSFNQERLWFLNQLEPESAAYNIHSAIRLQGALDTAILKQSIDDIIRRHSVLRTTFAVEEGQPVQVIHDHAAVELPIIDLSGAGGMQRETEIKKISAREANLPFNLEKGPLIRFCLLALGKEEHVLFITLHHIISDGWSTAVLVKDFTALYSSYAAGTQSTLKALPVQYGDYAEWQRRWMSGEVLKGEVAFWKQYLEGAPHIFELPAGSTRPPVQTSHGALYQFVLPGELDSLVKDLSRKEGATLFMTFLAAFGVLLYRYAGQEDILIGVPIAGRVNAQTESLIGFFVNTTVFRVRINADLSFSGLLKNIKEDSIKVFAHQDMPFEKLVEELHPERDMSRSPLFQVMFMFQNIPLAEIELPGLAVKALDTDNASSQFDVSLAVREHQGRLTGYFEYNTDLYDKFYIEALAANLLVLLRNITADPAQKVSLLEILSAEEKQRQLTACTGARENIPEALVHNLFEQQSSSRAEAVAVITTQGSITYGALNEKAGRLAGFLVQQGIGPEKTVGIFTGCCLEMMIAIMAVLKAGACYVPLDPASPQKRMEFMIREAGVAAVLTISRLREELPGNAPGVICVDTDWPRTASESGENFQTNCGPHNAACLIYTSGSTGEPRGVVLEHHSLVNLILSFIESYNAGENDKVLPMTSQASASFVGEILPILCAGGALVLADKNDFLDFDRLMQFITLYGITIISTVPAVMARLNTEFSRPPSLRLLLSGGEALLSNAVDKLKDKVTIVNGYGLTETAVCSTYYAFDADSRPGRSLVPIGKPVRNTRVYLLDKHLNLVPAGCPGEIFIAGSGLARGYLNNPVLTEQRFLADKFTAGARMYKTGDAARWLPDGNLEYIGRMDHQVKIRGFRIEPGEIEAAVLQYPGIKDTAVIVREDTPGEKRLAAYIVMEKNSASVEVELRQWLKSKLPDYMIPACFERLDELPLNANGKIDTQRLPVPAYEISGLAENFTAPRNETENKIAGVWKELLNYSQVGVHNNFFDIGGHSLLLTQVQTKLRSLFAKEISIIDLFKYPTISALAFFIDGNPEQEKEKTDRFQLAADRAKKQKEALHRQRVMTRKPG